jgi:hypothetical protein
MMRSRCRYKLAKKEKILDQNKTTQKIYNLSIAELTNKTKDDEKKD